MARLIGQWIALCSFLVMASIWSVAPVHGQDRPKMPKEEKEDLLASLEYRSIGPAAGGRVSQVCGVRGNALVYYAATASGGVWKSNDGGFTWNSIWDKQPVSSIGAFAVAPSDANVLYVGSGEANLRGNAAAGNGIYKSTDGGDTWQHVWKQEGQVGELIIHPQNADLAYAAVLGQAFGANPERGIYRTKNGGKTWEKVLFKDDKTGAIDICIDPNNPRIIFAALWQVRRSPWDFTTAGPGSGIFRSDDGGDSWSELRENGLPSGIWGRIGIRVAPSDSRCVYAIIEAEKGGLYRSDDGGKTWHCVHEKGKISQRPWYFSRLTIDPNNKDIVWCMNVQLHKSIDGGKTFPKVEGLHHVDHHDLWIDPENPKRMINANDGGVDISVNGGESWYAPKLPITQFYHISVNTETPYHVMGNMQDLGTAAAPNNSLCTDGLLLRHWYNVGGGETGYSVADPNDPNIIYSGEYSGYVSRFDRRTKQARNISIYPFNPSGFGAGEIRHRFQWTAPLMVSRHEPYAVYHAAEVLFRTSDGGKSWEKLGGDLTRNEKTKQQWTGGPITGDNTGVEYYGTIFAIAESPVKKGMLWAGSDDGLVHVSQDDGKTWTNVTKNINGLPEWGTVCCIEASPADPATAYIVVEAHRLNNMRPYLFKTTDFGKNWQSLSAGLSQDVYLHVVRCDPKVPGLLYVGTERGVSFSLDDGRTWESLQLNLPTVAVHDMAVTDNDLVVGTHGRSIWILDDLTPVRQLATLRKKQATLLSPVPTHRWQYHPTIYSTQEKNPGQNPPAGAIVHYYLPQKARESLILEIVDDGGKVVRTLTMKPEEKDEEKEKNPDAVLPNDVGLHRIVWDLRHTGGAVIPNAIYEAPDVKEGPLALPGTYQLKLKIDNASQLAMLKIVPDPRADTKMEELKEQLDFSLKLRDDIDKVAQTVISLQKVRNQLISRNDLLATNKDAKELVAKSKKLLTTLDDLEQQLHNPKAKVDYDILSQKGGAQLYTQLAFVFGQANAGDGIPTQGMKEVSAELRKRMEPLLERWQTIVTRDIAELNDMALKAKLPTIVIP